MGSQWLKVIVAGIVEVGWVIGLKHASSPLEWGVTLVAIFISFYFMISASKKLPVGTVYAVFVGIGTTGTVLVDSFLFGQPFTLTKVVLVLVLLCGVVGLKLATPSVEGGSK